MGGWLWVVVGCLVSQDRAGDRLEPEGLSPERVSLAWVGMVLVVCREIARHAGPGEAYRAAEPSCVRAGGRDWTKLAGAIMKLGARAVSPWS